MPNMRMARNYVLGKVQGFSSFVSEPCSRFGDWVIDSLRARGALTPAGRSCACRLVA